MVEPDPISENSKVDIVIFGGGIAGLWLLNLLCNRGFNVILLEATSLGSGQSVASQGIIHGGLKYALSGTLTGAASAIAEMPSRWRSCLDGKGDVNLTGCRLLSEHYYMWSGDGIRSRLKTFFGSKSLRGNIDALTETQYPPFFNSSSKPGSLYQLSDFVVDTTSLIEILSSPHKDRIFQVERSSVEFLFDREANADRIKISSSGISQVIEPQRFLFTAGEGNLELMQKAGLTSPQMQVRPLNMVVVRNSTLPLVYVHCIGDRFSLTPVLTLTSHKCEDGEVAWYLGGELAESGVGENNRQQIQAAKNLLTKLFPWVNLADSRWNCLDINRAEGKAIDQHRPDSVFMQIESRIIVAWPTKLTLSPALAEKVLSSLKTQGVTPEYCHLPEFLCKLFPTPAVAKPPWESLFEST